MSETAVVLHEAHQFSTDQIALIKTTVAKGTTNDELALFLYTAKRTGLDPLMKQIHAIKRWSKRDNREIMSIQTGIDGLRLIADRTDQYAPGPEPIIEEKEGHVYKVTAFVKKFKHGEWHVVPGVAYYDEYVQTDKEGRPVGLWAKMPRLMTAKCAEALALRKAFPAEMSGVYTFDEMTQVDSEPPAMPVAPPAALPTAAVPPVPSPAAESGVDATQPKETQPTGVYDDESEEDIRTELVITLSEIAKATKRNPKEILKKCTWGKDGKFATDDPNTLKYQSVTRTGKPWSPLKAALKKAKEEWELVQSDLPVE